MENILRLSLLFDFYGELLTEKQKSVFTLYNEDDFSLSEIAERLGVSRQAVSDSIRQAKSRLENYENSLGLVARYEKRQLGVYRIKEISERLIKSGVLNGDALESVSQIAETAEQMIKEGGV